MNRRGFLKALGAVALVPAAVVLPKVFSQSTEGFLTLNPQGIERMRMYSNGNIGLATPQPNALLHVFNADGPKGEPLNFKLGSDDPDKWLAVENAGAVTVDEAGQLTCVDHDGKQIFWVGEGGALNFSENNELIIGVKNKQLTMGPNCSLEITHGSKRIFNIPAGGVLAKVA